MLLPKDSVLSQILEALYEAPLNQSSWEEFLRLTALAVNGESAALMLHDFSNPLAQVSRQWNVDPAASTAYEQHYFYLDEWRKNLTPKSNLLGTSENLVPLAEIGRTEFYNDFLLPHKMPHGLFGIIGRDKVGLAHLSVFRSLRSGPFNTDNIDLVRFLEPHMQRAYKIHSELATTRGQTAGLATALNALSVGVILLGPRMNVILMNRIAERLLASDQGLLVVDNQICAERAGESARLEQLIAEAVNTSEGAGTDAAGATCISRCNLPALHLVVSPVRGMDLGEDHPVRAIVFISDPAKRVRPPQDVLQHLFELTPAECRVAMLMADGHAPSEIAQMVAVTQNTLKSQLSSIYRKTGVARQSQLVRLLMQLPGKL